MLIDPFSADRLATRFQSTLDFFRIAVEFADPLSAADRSTRSGQFAAGVFEKGMRQWLASIGP